MEERSRSRVWPALLVGGLVLAAVALLFRGPGPGAPAPSPVIGDPDLATATSTTVSTVTSTTLRTAPAGEEVIAGWSLVDGGPLTSRIGAATVWTGDELVVVGGTRSGGAYTDGAAFSPTLRRWRRIATPPISASRAIAGVWTGEEVIVFTERETAAYDPGPDRWRQITGRPAEAIHPIAATRSEGRVVLIARSETVSQDLVVVSLDAGGVWRMLAAPPLGVLEVTPRWVGEELMLVGTAGDAATALAYHPAADTWRVVAGLRLEPPVGAAPAAASDRLVAVGSELATMTLDAGGWTERSEVPLGAEDCAPDAVSVGHTAFLWYCGQAAVWEPGQRVWLPIQTPPSFPAEIFVGGSPVAVGGDRVMFWGGSRDGVGGPFLWELDLGRAQVGAAAADGGDR